MVPRAVRRWLPAIVTATAVLATGGVTVAAGASTTPTTAAGPKVVDLPATLVATTDDYTSGGSARCTERAILVVAVPPHVVDVRGSVRHKGTSFGSAFDYVTSEGPGFTNPITGYGPNYTVPKGEAGWFLGGGGGSAPCGNPLATWLDPRGFGTIPDNRVLVSGRVIDQTGNAVPGASVDVSGPDHVSTTTDSIGAFGVLVHRGTYRVTVSPPAVDKGLGVKAVSCETGTVAGAQCSGDTKNVGLKAGFQLTCPTPVSGTGATANADEVTGDAPADASTANGTKSAVKPICPLKVVVKRIEPLTSGLAVHSPHFEQYPVDFTAAKPNTWLASAGGASTYQCQSGCTELLVTVTDPTTGKPVDDASITASVDNLTPEYTNIPGTISTATGNGSPEDVPTVAAGDQLLCDTNHVGRDNPGCGATLTGVKTDYSGEAVLRYYAPGVIATASTDLKVSATANSCIPGACRLRKGEAKPMRLTVKAHLLYAASPTLSTAQEEELAAWAGGSSVFTKFLKLGAGGFKTYKYVLKTLNYLGVHAKEVAELLEGVEKAEPIGALFEVGEKLNALNERRVMIGMFLELTGLQGPGPGDDPFESSAPSGPALKFTAELANLNVTLPFEVGAEGFWWDVAGYLEKARGEQHPEWPVEGRCQNL
jgi:hypothetical protein